MRERRGGLVSVPRYEQGQGFDKWAFDNSDTMKAACYDEQNPPQNSQKTYRALGENQVSID